MAGPFAPLFPLSPRPRPRRRRPPRRRRAGAVLRPRLSVVLRADQLIARLGAFDLLDPRPAIARPMERQGFTIGVVIAAGGGLHGRRALATGLLRTILISAVVSRTLLVAIAIVVPSPIVSTVVAPAVVV